eukprot:6174334-Pleurochrysis_carterae.AAC.2
MAKAKLPTNFLFAPFLQSCVRALSSFPRRRSVSQSAAPMAPSRSGRCTCAPSWTRESCVRRTCSESLLSRAQRVCAPSFCFHCLRTLARFGFSMIDAGHRRLGWEDVHMNCSFGKCLGVRVLAGDLI